MIVICTQCQAKFRVADEKIGPRGAKVRCSKCQTVFVVQPPTAPAPAASPPASSRPDAAPPDAAVRPASSPAASARRPAPALDVDLEAAPPPPDPFAAPAAPDPFASRPDPFGGAAASPSPARGDDPFLAAALAGAGSAPAQEDPFAAPASPRGGGLPTTDLSDLLGGSGPAAPRAEPSMPPDLGLALEDRTTPPAFSAPAAATFDPESAGVFEQAGPGAFDLAGPGAFDPAGPGALDPSDPGAFGSSEPLALATDTTPAHPPPLPPPLPGDAPRSREAATSGGPSFGGPIPLPPDPDAVAPEPVPATPAERAQRAKRMQVPPAAPDRIPGRRGSRLRAVGVNAVALAALLVVALAMRVAWRGDGRLDPGALRPSAIVGALRPASADAGPFAAVDVRNGLYEREKAPPVLFVRGTVVARGRAPTVRAVRIAVELVRDGVVVARGDATAGAVPTPEELWAAADDGALAAVASRAAARAPRAVRPGDSVPFLVALADYPSDLGGVAVRVALEPRP